MTATATESGAPSTNETSPRVSHRKSPAVIIWFVITAGVLLMMWLEMRNNSGIACNLLLSGDSTDAGAEVWLDGARAGIMSGPARAGIGGALFYGYLSRGKHEIVVRKPGFRPFGENINMHREAYANVELSPQPAGNSQR